MFEKQYAVTSRGIIYKTTAAAKFILNLSHYFFWLGILIFLINPELGGGVMFITLVVWTVLFFISSLFTKEGV